jgi:hypothetical protein
MFLPEEYRWLEPVLIAAIVVFFVDWIGNTITFSNRVINAFVTALIFGLIFGALVYFGYGSIEMSVRSTPSPDAPASIQTSPAPSQTN